MGPAQQLHAAPAQHDLRQLLQPLLHRDALVGVAVPFVACAEQELHAGQRLHERRLGEGQA